jgi:hypothetical protein
MNSIKFNWQKSSIGDKITLISCGVMFISMFFDWLAIAVLGTRQSISGWKMAGGDPSMGIKEGYTSIYIMLLLLAPHLYSILLKPLAKKIRTICLAVSVLIVFIFLFRVGYDLNRLGYQPKLSPISVLSDVMTFGFYLFLLSHVALGVAMFKFEDGESFYDIAKGVSGDVKKFTGGNKK